MTEGHHSLVMMTGMPPRSASRGVPRRPSMSPSPARECFCRTDDRTRSSLVPHASCIVHCIMHHASYTASCIRTGGGAWIYLAWWLRVWVNRGASCALTFGATSGASPAASAAWSLAATTVATPATTLTASSPLRNATRITRAGAGC
jgi:hypothetical protein